MSSKKVFQEENIFWKCDYKSRFCSPHPHVHKDKWFVRHITYSFDLKFPYKCYSNITIKVKKKTSPRKDRNSDLGLQICKLTLSSEKSKWKPKYWGKRKSSSYQHGRMFRRTSGNTEDWLCLNYRICFPDMNSCLLHSEIFLALAAINASVYHCNYAINGIAWACMPPWSHCFLPFPWLSDCCSQKVR